MASGGSTVSVAMSDPVASVVVVVGGLAAVTAFGVLYCAKTQSHDSSREPQLRSDKSASNAPRADAATASKPSSKNSKKAKQQESKKDKKGASKPAAAAPEKKKKSKKGKGSGTSTAQASIASDSAEQAPAASEKESKRAPSKAPALEDGWEAVTVGKKRSKKGNGRGAAQKEAPTNEPSKPVAAPATAAAASAPSAAPSSGPASDPKTSAEAADSSDKVTPEPKEANAKTVRVDPRKIGIIIGPGGATLKKLEELSGCKLQVQENDQLAPGAAKQKPAAVSISGGSAEGLAIAQKAVTELASKGYAVSLLPPGHVESFIMVHPAYQPELIGQRGVVVQAIRDQLEVNLSFPKEKKDVTSTSRVRIMMAGPKEGVQRCKMAMAEIMRFYHSSVTHPGMVHAEFQVPADKMALFCGARGSNIRHIQGDSKAKVNLPRDYTENPNVVVVGYPDQVDVAKKHIVRILQSISDENRGQDQSKSGPSNPFEDDEDEVQEEWMREYIYRRK